MDTLTATIHKTGALLECIRDLGSGHSPQADTSSALKAIEELTRELKNGLVALKDAGDSQEVVDNHCSTVLGKLFGIVPTLGVLYRSKSTNNPFELYGPLRELAQRVIGSGTKVVLSSEWDYSPYTVVQIPELPDYVLIGLPAPEANNALLVPLAGHEFGHSIWATTRAQEVTKKRLPAAMVTQIRARIADYRKHNPIVGSDEESLWKDLQVRQTWLPLCELSFQQTEEVFCDLVGLWLFGEAYLHAFAYLLAPGLGKTPALYPSPRQRAEYLVRAAKVFGYESDTGYPDRFEGRPAMDETSHLRMEIADATTAGELDSLIELVREHMGKHMPEPIKSSESDEVYKWFDLVVPAPQPRGLAEIVNAGWRAKNNPTFWASQPGVAAKRDEVLNELILKTAEILEIRQGLGSNP